MIMRVLQHTLGLTKPPSYGFKPEEYGGKKHNLAPVFLSTRSDTCSTWLMLVLSMVHKVEGLKNGQKTFLKELHKFAPSKVPSEKYISFTLLKETAEYLVPHTSDCRS